MALQANSVGQCDTYTDPYNSDSTTHGCFPLAMMFLFAGIVISFISICVGYYKNKELEVKPNE